VEQIFMSGSYSMLPEPLKLKVEPAVPYTMQLFIIEGEDKRII
jgi:hypothetical protein